jgi:predicted aldo/keto reductase-like oxidoreductase
MITTRLGKTGLMVSRVGMGGIPLQRPSEGRAIQVVRRALELGVNFIDTAAGYGNSEERINVIKLTNGFVSHRESFERPGFTAWVSATWTDWFDSA